MSLDRGVNARVNSPHRALQPIPITISSYIMLEVPGWMIAPKSDCLSYRREHLSRSERLGSSTLPKHLLCLVKEISSIPAPKLLSQTGFLGSHLSLTGELLRALGCLVAFTHMLSPRRRTLRPPPLQLPGAQASAHPSRGASMKVFRTVML